MSKLQQGVNDLASKYPDLAKQWHPIKNGDITPSSVMTHSRYKAWWICKGCGEDYQRTVDGSHRKYEGYCKKCTSLLGGSSRRANHIVKYKSLAEHNPELVQEWHPTKNGDLKPDDCAWNSGVKVWWQCEKGHEWRTSINYRAERRMTGCPQCSAGQQTSFPEQSIFYYVSKAYPDAVSSNRQELDGLELDIYIPTKKIAIEYDGVYWHKNKIDKDVQKNVLCHEKGITLYRVREKGLPTLPHSDNVIEIKRTNNESDEALTDVLINLCKYLSIPCDVDLQRDRLAIFEMILARKADMSIAAKYPELIKEWHLTKNDCFTPQNTPAGNSRLMIWWQCKEGHEWQASSGNRIKGAGCPYCSNKKVLAGYNDLGTTCPDLAAEWHPTKNSDLTPRDVVHGSDKIVWWICDKGHEYQARIANRFHGKNCPICVNKKIVPGVNDLATINPELVQEWHPTKNGDLTPDMIAPNSNKKFWWKCELGHEWEATPNKRISNNRGCPYCCNQKILAGYNDLATTNPQLAAEWHPTKNGDLTPQMISHGSTKRVWWQCSQGHEWESTVNNRDCKKSPCPYCSGRK